MTLTGGVVVFLTSLTAFPFSYTLNTVSSTKSQLIIFLVGAVSFIFVLLVPWCILRKKMNKADPFFYALSLLAFSSVMSLIAALENDGLIAEFMGMYLREGEPYIKTAHGTAMAYLDGIFHYGLYLMMLAALSWNQSFHDVGLMWVGSYGYGTIVLTISVISGSDHVSWPFLLHVPYMVICLWAGLKFIREKYQETVSQELQDNDGSEISTLRLLKRPIDLCLVIYYVLAIFFTFFRFSAAMGGNMIGVKVYADKIEPYLTDSLPYPRVQQMVQLFYFVPYYALSIYGLVRPGQRWMCTWSLIFAGASAQAQLSFMGASLHYRTPYIHRVPQTFLARTVFWTANTLMLVVPQLTAFRIQSKPAFFLSSSEDDKSATVSSNGAVANHQAVEKKTD